MYGIFAYVYHKYQPNVAKYTSPIDAIGTLLLAAQRGGGLLAVTPVGPLVGQMLS